MANHLQPRAQGRTGRKTTQRQFRKNFLIVCEGAETEPNYFNAWRAKKQIETLGTGYNTLSLVNKAIQKRDQFRREGTVFDQTWVVFDRDDHKAQDFNAAIVLAESEDIGVAYSNQAFELWFVWHLIPLQAAWHRWQLREYLEKNLEGGYRKEDRDVYERLLERQEFALRNAQVMREEWGENHRPLEDNPSTAVDVLVRLLNANSAGNR